MGADRAFTLFLGEMAKHVGPLTVAGRLVAAREDARYLLPSDTCFVPLPPMSWVDGIAGALARSVSAIRRWWRALDGLDVVWVLGPHGLALPFALVALARRRRVVLGVRQDLPVYVRHRHPRRPALRAAALALDHAYRALARRIPVAVVGPDLARRYRRGRRPLDLTVSLVRSGSILSEPTAGRPTRPFRIITVGRLEREKNPLLLADIARELASDGLRWELEVCGEGPLEAALARGFGERGLAGAVRMSGYVRHEALMRRLRDADVLLHVSWTEGFPQVLVEAFAAGVPVVATDVGGVRSRANGAAMLIPAGDAEAAARALRQVRDDAKLRASMVRAGLAVARAHTVERETARLAEFLLTG